MSVDTRLVSTIICTYNRAHALSQTLASLAAVRVPDGWSAELILIDNGSTDRTWQVIQSVSLPNLAVRPLREPQRGKSHAYNAGLRAAQGTVILCTDDDIRFPENWIQGMCEPILSGEADAVAGGIVLAPHLERPWMTPGHHSRLGSTAGQIEKSQFALHGANLAFSKKVLQKVPGFDPQLGPVGLGAHEDTLFSLQLTEASYTIVPAYEVTVEHHADESQLLSSAFLDRARKAGRSGAYVAHHWEHRVIANPLYLLLWHILRLQWWRVSKCKEGVVWQRRQEGRAIAELSSIEAIAFYHQYLTERKRPRNYTRRGLRKLV